MMTRHEFRFSATLSMIYHRRRATFLERASLLMTLLTLIGGASGVISLFGDGKIIAQIAGGLVTLIGLIDIVYRPAASAAVHRDWLKRWTAIKNAVESTKEPSEDDYRLWRNEIAVIETECVGELRALQGDCYNRTVRKLDIDTGNNYALRWYHRLLCQIVSFEHGFEARA